MRKPALAALLVVVLLAAAGCSQGVHRWRHAGPLRLPPPLSPAAKELIQLDPCALVPAEEVARMGSRPAERDDYRDHKGCLWTFPDGGGLLHLQFWKDLTVEEIQTDLGDTYRDVFVIDGRRGRITGDPYGKCWIALPIGSGARVDIVSLHRSRETTIACDRAERLAHVVEPQLPE